MLRLMVNIPLDKYHLFNGENIMPAHYKFIASKVTNNQDKLEVTLYLVLADITKHQELLTSLQNNNKFLLNHEIRQFTPTVSTCCISPSDETQTSECIQIVFELKGAHRMFKFITQQLHNHGYSLSLIEAYILRVQFFDVAENICIRRANKLIQQLVNKNQIDSLLEYSQLQRMIYETPLINRLSMLQKIVKILKAHGLNKHALGLCILYINHPMFSNIASELETITSSELDKKLEEIINSPHTATHYNIGTLNFAKTDVDNLSFLIQGLQPEVIDKLAANLITSFSFKDTEYKFILQKINIDTTQVASIAEQNVASANVEVAVAEESESGAVATKSGLLFSFAREDQYKILDFIFMQLESQDYLLEASITWQIREQLGFTNKHYQKFAEHIVEQLSANGDEPASLEYNWLVRMAYDAPPEYTAQFAFEVATKLKNKGLNLCALMLAYVGFEDQLCPEIMPLIEELRVTLENTKPTIKASNTI